MAEHLQSNVSQDLVWEISRMSFANGPFPFRPAYLTRLGPNNSYLVKRKSGGGSQFSKDPLNLMNKHSRKARYCVSANDLCC